MKHIVGIAISLALMLVLVQGTVFAGTVSKTQVYIDNTDDDSLWIKVHLDGRYMGGKITPPNTTRYFAFYRLSEGLHELKSTWRDPDTCEWREKTKTFNATGDDLTVTIGVVPQNISTCKKAPLMKSSPDHGSLSISVTNNDDDALFVMLFINGDRRRERTVARYSTASFLNIFSIPIGSYNISIRWKEPDTKVWHEKTQEMTVVKGKNSLTLETDEVIYSHEPAKPTSAIDIYVKNIDDDDLWVDVIVDSGYAMKYVRSGSKKYFRRFGDFYPGKHTVRLRWIDPDVLRWQEKGFIVYLEDGEVLTKTFSTDRNVPRVTTYEGWMNLV